MKNKLLLITLFFILFMLRAMGQDSIHRPLVGLVLSGGGAKGLAHIGVLK